MTTTHHHRWTTSPTTPSSLAFDGDGLAPGSFHHRHHVRVAWILLERRPLLEVLAALHRRPASPGRGRGQARPVPRDDHLGLRPARQRAEGRGRGGGLAGLRGAQPDLLAWRPSVLEARYYREETLWSDRARRTFVLPDRPLTA